jgi:hypothetical protein
MSFEKEITDTQQEWLDKDVEQILGYDGSGKVTDVKGSWGNRNADGKADKQFNNADGDNDSKWWQKAAKVFPITAINRAGLLVVMKINLFGMATRLYPAMFKEREWKDAGFRIDNAKRSVTAYDRIAKLFKNIGGDVKNLDKNIIKGSSRRIQKWNTKTKGIDSTNEMIVPPKQFLAMHRMNVITPENEKRLINNIKAWIQYAKDGDWKSVDQADQIKGATFQFFRVPDKNAEIDYAKAKTFGINYIDNWNDLYDIVLDLTDPIVALIKTTPLQKQNFRKMIRGWFFMQEDMAKKGNAGFTSLVKNGTWENRVKSAVWEGLRKHPDTVIDENKTKILGIEDLISWSQIYDYALQVMPKNDTLAIWWDGKTWDTKVVNAPVITGAMKVADLSNQSGSVTVDVSKPNKGSYSIKIGADGKYCNEIGTAAAIILAALPVIGTVLGMINDAKAAKNPYVDGNNNFTADNIPEEDKLNAFIEGVMANNQMTDDEKRRWIDYAKANGTDAALALMGKAQQSGTSMTTWIAVGVGGLLAVGTAIYFIFRKK